MTTTLNIDKSNWKKYRFGDVAIQTKEVVDIENTTLDRYIAGEHMDSEDLHIRRWGIVGDGYLGPAFIRKFSKGDILYGSRRTYLKKVAIADFDGITANTTFVIKPTELIHPILLAHLMLSEKFTEYSIKNSRGSVNPYINWKDIADYEFLLPQLAEQQHLAELLWAADEVVEKEKRELEGVERMLQTYLDEFNAKHKPNAKLGDCLIVKKTKSKAPHRIEKYVGLEHIESGQRTTEKYDSSENVLADSYIFQKGDLLYSKLRPYLDKCIIADFDGICTTELIVYDTKDNASKEYILNILHSKSFLDYIVDKGFGTKMPRVSHEIVSNYDFYLPSESEQKELLVFINKINNCAIDIKSQITKSQEVKQEIINKIF